MSLSTHYLEYGRHVARLRRRAYASTSNTAAHDNHEKIHTWVSFSYLVMGLCLAALRAAGAPLLYIELSNSLLIGRKRTVNFRNQRP